MTLRPFSIAHEILYDENKKRATGVKIIDAETNMTYEYKAKVIFLCAFLLLDPHPFYYNQDPIVFPTEWVMIRESLDTI